MRIDKRSYIYIYPFALVLCWATAWLLHIWLGFQPANEPAATVYWVSAKLVIWLAPVFILITVTERARWQQFLELSHPLKGVVVGLLTSLLLIAVFYVIDRKKQLALPALSLALLNAVIVAPLVEEIVFRGFYLQKLLLNGVQFWVANGLTSIFFVGMHLPGWYFQRKLHVDSVLGPVVSLSLFSLLLGLVKVKTKSLYATILIHVLNNLYSLAH